VARSKEVQAMLLLSSGLEDFFHYNPGEHEFSPYRFHDDDPIFFHNGFKLTARCGEKVNGQVIGNPPKAQSTTWVWLYQW
jgi:hypothetical protein